MNSGSAFPRGDSDIAPIYLKLLGDMHVKRLPDSDATPRSKRGRALLAYLALSRDHTAQRTRLADLFWGDRGEAQARGSLRQCLLEIRGAAGAIESDFVRSDREAVSLAGDWSSDVTDIDRMLQSADPGVVADACEIAGRETLLGGLAAGEEFDDWLKVERAVFDRKLADAALRGLRLAIESGDGDAARRIADQYLTRDPGDEEVTVLAMQADGLRGAAPVAHRRFQKLRDHLSTEFDAAPGPAAVAALAAVASAPAPQPIPIAAPDPVGGPPLLLVGPFTETGFESDLRHVGGGVREEVVSGLSRFRDLRVLVEDRVPSTIEAPLYGGGGRAYALTANLRVADGRMRVTPVLTRLADRAVVWSQPVDVAAMGLERAIDTMVDRIVGAVAPNVERDAVRRSTTNDIYDRYLAAHYESFPAKDHAVAVNAAQRLESIIAEAPHLAVAYPPLMRLYNTNYVFTVAGVRCDDERVRAFELGQTALTLDRGHVHCYSGMGWCQLWRGGWDAAHVLFEQTLQINPYHSVRLKEAAFGMTFLGNRTLSDALLARSLEIDPLPNDGYFEDLGLLRIMQGRAREATSYLDLLVAPTIWAELYAALAARAIGRADVLTLVAKWMTRITDRWRGETPMTIPALVEWIGYHHPFRDRADFDTFMALVSETLPSTPQLAVD